MSSGGKDSCFNLLHCLANGHEIVALARLAPPAGEGGRWPTFQKTGAQCEAQWLQRFYPLAVRRVGPADELDSFMYQTVGHEAVALVAECMNLPLFTETIRGKSVARERDYVITESDEVEDLARLLQAVRVGVCHPPPPKASHESTPARP